MGRVLHVALHDLRLHLADRSNVFFLLLMPIGFVFFFTMVNSGGGDPADVRVSLPVVDGDGDFLAQAFVEQLRGENFDVPVYSVAAAETLTFRARSVSIPDSFTRRVLAGEETDVTLRASATSDAGYDFAAQVRLHQAQVRFLGNLVRWAGVGDSTRAGPDGIADAADLDAAEKGRFLAMVAEPPLVKVESRFAGTGRPVPSGTRQSVPGVLVMFVIMTVLINGSEALTREKQLGTLKRLVTTPLTASQVLLGKTLGLALLGVAQVVIVILATEGLAVVGVGGVDFRWGPVIFGVAPTLVAYCVCVAALGLLLSGLLRTPQQAESIAWLVGMGLSALGGAWWPLEIMPGPMQFVGSFFPTSWAMEGLHTVITYGQGVGATLSSVGVLLGMAALFWIVGSRTLRVVD